MPKWVIVNFDLCRPGECDPGCGRSPALKACRRKVLVQEDPFDPPVIVTRELCRGCQDCVKACPQAAIEKSRE